MLTQLQHLFRVGNRRRHRENSNVLRVKLRTDELRRVRTRFAAQVLTVFLSGAALLFIGWRGVDWAVKEFVTENPAFVTKTIDLQTDGVLTTEALRRWAGVHIGENLMRFDLTRIKRELELVPLIQSVAVERTRCASASPSACPWPRCPCSGLAPAAATPRCSTCSTPAAT